MVYRMRHYCAIMAHRNGALIRTSETKPHPILQKKHKQQYFFTGREALLLYSVAIMRLAVDVRFLYINLPLFLIFVVPIFSLLNKPVSL